MQYSIKKLTQIAGALVITGFNGCWRERGGYGPVEQSGELC